MSSKGCILCVNDHRDICELVRTILAGYETVFAHSRADALQKVERGLFDLYLLDDSRPDGAGLEVATLIRQFDDSTPILFLTTPRALTYKHALMVGAQGVISTDDLTDDLLVTVSRILHPLETA